MWSDWLVFCDCGFQSVCPMMDKDKRLMKAFWWDTLTEGETGSCSDGWGHAQEIFNPIFCWWMELFSLSVSYLGPNYGGGNEDNGDLLHSVPPTLQRATANPCLHGKLLDTHGQVQVSLLWSHCSFLLGSGAHKVLFVPSKSLFLQSCVSSGMLNDDLLQEGSCCTWVCCTQSPCPCGSPLLTHTP